MRQDGQLPQTIFQMFRVTCPLAVRLERMPTAKERLESHGRWPSLFPVTQ